MTRPPTLDALLLWGATVYLVTHGMVPPDTSRAEVHDLAAACCTAAGAWLHGGLGRIRGWVAR